MEQMTEYQKDLLEVLKNSNEATAYLNAALDEGDKEAFLLALRSKSQNTKENGNKASSNSFKQPGSKSFFWLTVISLVLVEFRGHLT